MTLRKIINGEFAKDITSCDPRLRGMAICHLKRQCESCPHAIKFRDEHPEEFEEAV